jgi:hypothetical protein
MDVLGELAKHAPSFIWGGLAFWAVYVFRSPMTNLFQHLSALKAVGVEMSFVEHSMAQAAADANRNNQIVASTVPKSNVEVTRSDRERVLARAERSVEVIKGKRLLWLDDYVANNRLEREMLEAFGLKIEQVQSNEVGLAALGPGSRGYDLIISDIGRDNPDQPNGLAFLSEYRASGGRLPLIYYVSVVDVDKALPPGAFGLTNRPDELLHLVIDALERSA